jgi:hypothetical protein
MQTNSNFMGVDDSAKVMRRLAVMAWAHHPPLQKLAFSLWETSLPANVRLR